MTISAPDIVSAIAQTLLLAAAATYVCRHSGSTLRMNKRQIGPVETFHFLRFNYLPRNHISPEPRSLALGVAARVAFRRRYGRIDGHRPSEVARQRGNPQRAHHRPPAPPPPLPPPSTPP